MKSYLVGVNNWEKQLGMGKLNYLCLLMYSPHKERQEEHLQTLTALSAAYRLSLRVSLSSLRKGYQSNILVSTERGVRKQNSLTENILGNLARITLHLRNILEQ